MGYLCLLFIREVCADVIDHATMQSSNKLSEGVGAPQTVTISGCMSIFQYLNESEAGIVIQSSGSVH